MARQPSEKDSVPTSAGAKDADLDELAESEELTESDQLAESDELDESDQLDDIDDDLVETERPPSTVALWSSVRIEPVEISLRQGTGYTLRAYRMSDELAVGEIDVEDDEFAAYERNRRPAVAEDEEFDEDLEEELDDLDVDADARRRSSDDDNDDVVEVTPVGTTRAKSGRKTAKDRTDQDEDEDDELVDEDDLDPSDDADEPDEVDFDDEDEDEKEPEEVPVFLGHRGKVYLFRSAEGLVAFVKSDAEHDLVQLDTWVDLKTRLKPEHVVPAPEDRYELDLIVENLRGGHDAWDTDLLIRAGEVARDLGYALRMEAVLSALSSGSPLDDLDEALRSATSGGMGGFFAKRKLRKIGAQQAALGWRTVIGKITAVVDWRD